LDDSRGLVVASAPRTPGLGHAFGMLPPRNYSALYSFRGLVSRPTASRRQDSYLVDSASSHMLVSKIKPCMSKYKQSIL
jgi:hypothetical protein